jgi:hypothetical protein
MTKRRSLPCLVTSEVDYMRIVFRRRGMSIKTAPAGFLMEENELIRVVHLVGKGSHARGSFPIERILGLVSDYMQQVTAVYIL